MLRRNFLSYCLALVASVTLLLTGCNSSKDKRLILLTNGDDPFWDAMRAGMEDAARDSKLAEAGLKAEMDKNDNTPAGQIDKLNQYAGQGDIAAVAISVTDAKSSPLAKAMRRLQEKGIKVITIDSDVDRATARDARFAYLGTDNIIGGRELAKTANGLRPQGGKYAAFVGLKSAANAQERMQGFAEGTGAEFEQIDYLGDNMDLLVAEKNVQDVLNNHPQIDTLVGIWAYNAHAIASAVADRKLRDKTTIIVFDAAPRAISHMGNKMIDAMVVQNPYDMGYRGTQLMKSLVQNDDKAIKEMLPEWDAAKKSFATPEGDLITTGLKVVVPDEQSPLKKEMFESDTEFLTLPQFQTWLDKYKLKGS